MMTRFIAVNISADKTIDGHILIMLIIFCRKIHLEQFIQLADESLVTTEKTYKSEHVLRCLEREVP